MYRLVAPLLLAVLLATAACVSTSPGNRIGSPANPVEIDREALADVADTELVAPLRRLGAEVSVVVGNPHTRQLLYGVETTRLRLPASMQKMFVAADAMLRFPTEHRFTTTVFSNGRLDNAGMLHGDLILSGGWDPSLAGDRPYSDWPWTHFDRLADSLHALGVREIGGRLIVEAAAYVPAGWEIGDFEHRYAPRISQLMWNDGLVSHAEQVAGLQGGEPLQSVWPDPVFWSLDHNQTWPRSTVPVLAAGQVLRSAEGADPDPSTAETTSRTRLDSAFHEPIIPTDTWDVRHRPSPSPRALAADAFRASLRRSMIRGGDSTLVIAPNPVRMPMPAYGGVRIVHRSAPLDSLLAPMLQVSSNAWAEQIAAACGSWTDDGRYEPTWPAVLDSLELPGRGGLYAADACGMARRNRMRPETVHHLLSAALQRWEMRWLELLPHANQQGSTLEGRLAGLEKRVRAKTGTLSDARTLAGYLLDREGRPVLDFVIVVNQTPESPTAAIDATVRRWAELVAAAEGEE